jgi:transposase InsO family protein
MAYTNNPRLPKVRMEAVKLLRSGWSTRETARYFGFNQSTIVRWAKKASFDERRIIPTLSSRPHHHPKELSRETVSKIIQYREKHKRCAEVIHHLLKKDGTSVSLSSVKRTLKRNGMIRHSPWKKWHTYPERPLPEKPGSLVQIDTIFDGEPSDRLYIYTLIDVCSRWVYAEPMERISTWRSWDVIKRAQKEFPFAFKTIQSDHGSEFSLWLTKKLKQKGFEHRHSRIRRPTDNGHLERFNRTIQEECLAKVPKNLSIYKKKIKEYIKYYNEERPHMALNMKTPLEVMQSY